MEDEKFIISSETNYCCFIAHGMVRINWIVISNEFVELQDGVSINITKDIDAPLEITDGRGEYNNTAWDTIRNAVRSVSILEVAPY